MDQKTSVLGRGRPPLFDEVKALVVLKNRILAGEGTRLREFIEGESAEGNLPADISIPTLQNLLSGRMFPNLIDPETGQKFDYNAIPHAAPGRPSRFNEDGIDPVTNERRRGIPLMRQMVIDKAVEETRRVTDARVVYHFTSVRRELDEQLAQMRRHYDAQIEALEQRLSDLTNVAC